MHISLPLCRKIEDDLYGLPSQLGTVLSLILPCYTMWRHRQLIASHPEVVVLLPILLTHAAYMALGTWKRMQAEAADDNPQRISWSSRMKERLRKTTFGAMPFAMLILIMGIAVPALRPFALIASGAILLSVVVAILLVTTLAHWRVRTIGGPLTSASLFGVTISCYLIPARILFAP